VVHISTPPPTSSLQRKIHQQVPHARSLLAPTLSSPSVSYLLHEDIDNTEARLGKLELENSAFGLQPDSLYPRALLASGFRIFILEPGVIGPNIVGKIKHFDFLQHPPYVALSYVWGQEPPIHHITVNKQVTFIRPNLYHSLQRIRLRNSRLYIWIDSICINQRSDRERILQVRRMATIYRRASGVLVWLGEEDSTSRIALEFIAQIIRGDFRWYGPWWQHYGIDALAHILERYWSRRG
jgi:hypothetical protein